METNRIDESIWKKVVGVRWTNLVILQSVLDRAKELYKEYNEWEFDFDLDEDVISEGVLTRDDGTEESFRYAIEGCDSCLGEDYVTRPDGADLCGPDVDWDAYEFIGDAYTNEMIKACGG